MEEYGRRAFQERKGHMKKIPWLEMAKSTEDYIVSGAHDGRGIWEVGSFQKIEALKCWTEELNFIQETLGTVNEARDNSRASLSLLSDTQ